MVSEKCVKLKFKNNIKNILKNIFININLFKLNDHIEIICINENK